MARLDFGLFYEIPVAAPWHARSERDAYHRVIDQAVLGEQVGFSHFWTVEHHFLSEFSHCSAPEVLYGAVAARTKTIRIGHGVRLLPFRIGVPPEALGSRIALSRSGLKEARPAGKFVNDRAATFTMVHCAETNEEARRNAAASVLWYFRRSIELIGSVAAWQEGRELGTYDYTRMLRALNLSDVTFPLLDDMDAVIVGDPETCIRKVKVYREPGCDPLLCLMQPYDIAADAVTRSIELFGRYVIPACR